MELTGRAPEDRDTMGKELETLYIQENTAKAFIIALDDGTNACMSFGGADDHILYALSLALAEWVRVSGTSDRVAMEMVLDRMNFIRQQEGKADDDAGTADGN